MGKCIRKKNSAPKIRVAEQKRVASNLANMYRQLWCYRLLFLSPFFGLWSFFCWGYQIFRPSHPWNPTQIWPFANSFTWNKCPNYAESFSANTKKEKRSWLEVKWTLKYSNSEKRSKTPFFGATSPNFCKCLKNAYFEDLGAYSGV